jgi:hypothetical protein
MCHKSMEMKRNDDEKECRRKAEKRRGRKLARFLYPREGQEASEEAGSERDWKKMGVAGSEMGGRKKDGWLEAR